MAVRLLQNLHDVHHVGGEGGQALLNALLVADIRQHPVEYAHRAAVVGGDVEPALGHEGQKAQGLQAHGLAAGVGPGDDQGVEPLAQLNGDGHGTARVQQGVAGVAEADAAVAPDLRPAGVHLIAELAPGEDEIQAHQQIVVREDVAAAARRLGGQLPKDALDLLFLLGLQLLELVVGLDHTHGLHKDGGAAGADVVDKAREAGAELRLHRHHEPAVPLGDDGLLEDLAVALGGDDLLQYLPALGGRHPHVAADVRQGGAGGVGDYVLLQDGGEDPLLQESIPPQGGEENVNGGLLLLIPRVVPHPPGAAEHPGDVQQLPGVQGAAVVRPVETLRHGLDAREGRGALQPDHVPGRVRLVLETLHVVHVRLRDQGQGLLPGRGAVGLVRQHPQDRWQLQGTNGFIK